jgi:hypothetical protein
LGDAPAVGANGPHGGRLLRRAKPGGIAPARRRTRAGLSPGEVPKAPPKENPQRKEPQGVDIVPLCQPEGQGGAFVAALRSEHGECLMNASVIRGDVQGA